MKNDFNPVKEEKDGVRAKRMIWTTKAVEMALKGLEEGRKLVSNPFYENNTKLLKGDLVFNRTAEEVEDWKHCMNDIIFFVTKCKLMTPEGIQHITLRDYQEKYLKHLVAHRLSIYLACRQCSKTTMSAIFLLWYVLFNVDKNALVLGNKRKTAVEILDKIKKIYLELPYYLKPGIYKWNESEIVFDNGCRIMAEATTINSGISFTFHCVLADEFAHIAPNIKEKFYNNLFPTITAGKSRFMITSTQNGFDLFCRLYKAAEQHLNEYAAFKTDWDEVPEWNPDKHCWEKRDEAWHQLQVANYGSEEAFNAQFGTSFDINANTLIDPKFLRKKQHEAEEFEYRDLFGVSGSEYYKWKPGFDPMEDLRRSFITVTIDIAEGIGKDFTTFIFNRMTPFGDECVGMFHCNIMNIDKSTVSLMEICTKYLNPNQHCISLEWNTYGELFLRIMMTNRDKYPSCNNFDETNIVKYYNDSMTKITMGIKLTSTSKTIGCKLFKDQFEHGHIVNKCTDFLLEVENFSDTKDNGTYQASFGHDDIIMAQIQLVHAKQSNAYKYLRSEYESSLIAGYQEREAANVEDSRSATLPVYNPYTQIDMSQYKDGQFFDPTKVFRSMDDIYNSIEQRAQNNARQGIPSMWS